MRVESLGSPDPRLFGKCERHRWCTPYRLADRRCLGSSGIGIVGGCIGAFQGSVFLTDGSLENGPFAPWQGGVLGARTPIGGAHGYGEATLTAAAFRQS